MPVKKNAQRQHTYSTTLRHLVRLVQGSIFEPIARWNRRREAVAVLSSLDDRILTDIGLTRDEVSRSAQGQTRNDGEIVHNASHAETILSLVDPLVRRAARWGRRWQDSAIVVAIIQREPVKIHKELPLQRLSELQCYGHQLEFRVEELLGIGAAASRRISEQDDRRAGAAVSRHPPRFIACRHS